MSIEDEIKEALTRVNGDVLADLDGSIKKQATASFIQLAKDDETAALSLFQELMRDGNIAAVELAKHVSRDKSINMQFKRDMQDALKLIADKLASRRKEIAALDSKVVAGSLENSELAMTTDNVFTTATILNIPVVTQVLQALKGYRVLVIDSDVDSGFQYPEHVDVMYQNIQAETASCGDNAFCTANKAKALGLEPVLYLHKNHLVAMVYYPENKDPSAVLASIEATEIKEDKVLWETYKEVMVGATSEPVLNTADPDKEAHASEISSYLISLLLQLQTMSIAISNSGTPWWPQPNPDDDPTTWGDLNKGDKAYSILIGANITSSNLTNFYE